MGKTSVILGVFGRLWTLKPRVWVSYAALGRSRDVGTIAQVLEARGLAESRRVKAGKQIRLTKAGTALMEKHRLTLEGALDQLVLDTLLDAPRVPRLGARKRG